MKKETIEIIRKKLQADVESARDSLTRNIEMSNEERLTQFVTEKIKAYKAAYDVLKDFEEWAEDQEDE